MLRIRDFLLTVLLVSCFLPVNATTVRVNANGNDYKCSPTNNLVGYIQCRSIERAYDFLQGQSNVTIYIETDIDMNQVLAFKGVSDIAINGVVSGENHHNSVPIVKCSGTAGFYVEDVHNFSMSNLELTNCSALEEEHGYISALIFKMSFDIQLSNTTILKSKSSGIIFLNCYANIDLNKVTLYQNGLYHPCPSKATGLVIENTSKLPPSIYTIKNCAFLNNNNTDACPRNITFNTTIRWGKLNLGGGMNIVMAADSANNRVILDNCIFTNNTAKWGGGLYVHFQNDTRNNTVKVTNCVFAQNIAKRAGGGANVGFLNSKELSTRTNMIYFQNTVFKSNNALYGGGLALFSTVGNVPYSKWSNMVFINCSWRANNAAISPAVDISPVINSNMERNGFLPLPGFHDIDIRDHHIHKKRKKLKITKRKNSGVFLVTQFKIHFSGRVTFRNNSNTALQTVSSGVVFESNTEVKFVGNKGINGAAIAMYGFSYISLLGNTSFLFKKNLATNYGAGIYYSGIDQHQYLTGSSCFIEYNGPETNSMEERNINFTFEGNIAQSGGQWIYADSFQSCIHHCRLHNSDRNSVCSITKCIGDFKCNESIQSMKLIMSSGKSFTFGDHRKNYSVIPGAMLKIPFNVTDDFKNILHPLLSIKVTKPELPIEISRKYSLSGIVYPIGPPNNSAKVEIAVEGIRTIAFHFYVSTLQCPPGFVYDNSVLSCVCGTEKPSKYTAVLSCNMTTFRADMNKQYWAGYIPESSQNYTDLYFAPCSAPICRTLASNLPSTPSELDQYICGDNRRGLMCGKCLQNYSVYFHSRSFSCQHKKYCHLGPLFYILSELLPMVVLFGVVVAFDLSFTSGNVVGFIFFCQYLSGLTLQVNSVVLLLRNPYRLLYGMFNLEYFTVEDLSYCLWKHFDIQDIIAFKYVTILFALALVLMLITLIKTDRCKALFRLRTRLCDKTSFIHGLSAFLVICYIQCTRTSFLLLKYVQPVGLNGKPTATLTYYGGSLYFRDKHLFYGIIAIISLLVVTVIPPVILLVYPLYPHLLSLCGVSEHWLVVKMLRFFCFQKLIPFIDCFQSCYKDRCRFFAGLYFVYRICLLVCFVVTESSYELLVVLEILLVSFLGVHAVVQPYKERRHNVIDALIFANLALINALSIAGIAITQTYDESTPMLLSIIQFLLLNLPMLAFLIWLVWKLCCCNKNASYEVLDNDIIEDRKDWLSCTVHNDGANVREERRNSKLRNYST